MLCFRKINKPICYKTLARKDGDSPWIAEMRRWRRKNFTRLRWIDSEKCPQKSTQYVAYNMCHIFICISGVYQIRSAFISPSGALYWLYSSCIRGVFEFYLSSIWAFAFRRQRFQIHYCWRSNFHLNFSIRKGSRRLKCNNNFSFNLSLSFWLKFVLLKSAFSESNPFKLSVRP